MGQLQEKILNSNLSTNKESLLLFFIFDFGPHIPTGISQREESIKGNLISQNETFIRGGGFGDGTILRLIIIIIQTHRPINRNYILAITLPP